jgi:hypothetical protein
MAITNEQIMVDMVQFEYSSYNTKIQMVLSKKEYLSFKDALSEKEQSEISEIKNFKIKTLL